MASAVGGPRLDRTERPAGAGIGACVRRAAKLTAGLPPLLAHPWIGPALLFLCNLPGLACATNRPLAQDPDTLGILLPMLKDTSLPGLLSWFGRDWPLGNGFYRPLVALSLAADHALWGEHARGYRLVNWALAVVVAFAVRWWLSSLTSRRAFGTLAAMVFSLRQAGLCCPLPQLWVVAAGAACLGVLAHAGRAPSRRPAREWALFAGCALVVWELEWRSNSTLISWIAARTALLGALFCVLSLAGFARYHAGGRRGDALLALAAGAAALASYEQSVVLPLAAAATLLAVGPAARGRAMPLLLAMLLLVAGYGVLRLSVIGARPTGYHLLQTKTSLAGPALELTNYVLPPRFLGGTVLTTVATAGWLVVYDANFWWASLLIALWCLAYDRVRRRQPRLGLALWCGKLLLFLPMATLHVFPHYFYLPEAAAAGLAVLLLWPGILET